MSFTLEDLEDHKDVDDCWIAINGSVYDVTEYVRIHPGGRWIILNYAGGDATEGYMKQMHSEVADGLLKEFYIGKLKSDCWSVFVRHQVFWHIGKHRLYIVTAWTWVHLLAPLLTLISWEDGSWHVGSQGIVLLVVGSRTWCHKIAALTTGTPANGVSVRLTCLFSQVVCLNYIMLTPGPGIFKASWSLVLIPI